MDTDALRTAILANDAAKSLADAGNDAGCAATIAPTLPPEIAETHATERTIFAAFTDDPTLGETFMQVLEGVAAGNPAATPPIPGNPILARALKWMQPNNGGVDVGNPAVRGMLDQVVAADLGMTQAMADRVKALAERPAVVSADDVSRAWKQFRVS